MRYVGRNIVVHCVMKNQGVCQFSGKKNPALDCFTKTTTPQYLSARSPNPKESGPAVTRKAGKATAVIYSTLYQRRNPHLFVVPPVLQEKDLIPRSRLLVFACQGEIYFGAHLAQNPGFCLRSPRGDWAPFERSDFRVLYAKTGGF